MQATEKFSNEYIKIILNTLEIYKDFFDFNLPYKNMDVKNIST